MNIVMNTALEAFLIVLGVIGGVGLLVFLAVAVFPRFRAGRALGLNDQGDGDGHEMS